MWYNLIWKGRTEQNMKQRITGVAPGSPAAKAGIIPGHTLCKINGSPVWDVIDYEQLTVGELIVIETEDEDKSFTFSIVKETYEPLGLNFESSLMSPIKQCANHCIFCFIDQMPHGNRKTLYFKDDDWRLSLIMGNYVTLTNVSDREFERILKRRVSPLYISVHSTDGAVREKMMRSRNADRIMQRLTALHENGLCFHCQVVLCPGYNDGDVLVKTLEDLNKLRPECRTVAIVPVGMTQHREGLAKLDPVTKEIACDVIRTIDEFRSRHNIKGFAYASDEMYLRAEAELPSFDECGDFEQIENGVGLYRQFEHDFIAALEDFIMPEHMIEFDSVCGVSIAPLMQSLFDKLLPFNIKINVHPVYNDFFGRSITVSGLTTARDILAQYSGKLKAKALILPHTMLRENDVVFLDGMTTDELSKELGVPVYKVSADDGYDFIDNIQSLIGDMQI